MDRDEFLQADKFVLEANMFVFNGVFYKQVFGIAMGSPISSVIANKVMQACPTFVLIVARSQIPPTKKTFRSWAWVGAAESEEQLGAARASKSLDRPVVMERLETVSLSKVPFQLIFYKRYVDDIITSLPKLEDL